MNAFSIRVIKVIKSIPCGKVLSYGRVALLAGKPRGARQVGWLLNSSSEKYKLPWHRVVNSKGQISIMEDDLQKFLLMDEGVVFKNNHTIDMKTYMWDVEDLDFDKIDL